MNSRRALVFLAAIVLLAGILVGQSPSIVSDVPAGMSSPATEPEELSLEEEIACYLSQYDGFQYVAWCKLSEDRAWIGLLSKDVPLPDETTDYLYSLVTERCGYARNEIDFVWIFERPVERPTH